MEKICPTYSVRRLSVVSDTFPEIIPNRKFHYPKQLCYIGRISFALGKFHIKANETLLLLFFFSCRKALKLIEITIRRNPNEPPQPEHGGRQEKSRFKNIEWTPYETVHKKYLNLGEYHSV